MKKTEKKDAIKVQLAGTYGTFAGKKFKTADEPEVVGRCISCTHWTNLSKAFTNIKKSDFGLCGNPRAFGFDFLIGYNKIDKQKQLTGKDEILIISEYFQIPNELPNATSICPGKYFGCVHHKNKPEDGKK